MPTKSKSAVLAAKETIIPETTPVTANPNLIGEEVTAIIRENTLKIIAETGYASNQYSEAGIDKLISKANEAKSKLREKLRKHPLWNEEAQALIFAMDEYRPIETEKCGQYADALFEYIFDRCDETSKNALRGEAWNVYFTLKLHGQKQFCDDVLQRELEGCTPSFKATVGEKVSKIWNRFWKSFANGDISAIKFTDKNDETPEDRSFLSYDKLFAKLADSTSPIKVTRISVLSINVNDFLSMSRASWESCHKIGTSNGNRGSYSGGCISYALDETSMIFYVIDKDTESPPRDFCFSSRITRQMFFFDVTKFEWFIQSRLYPRSEDSEKSLEIRLLIQKIWSEVINQPNYWTLKNKPKEGKSGGWEKIRTVENSAHYRDYEYEQYHPTINYLKSVEFDTCAPLLIGSKQFCIKCGDDYSEGGANRGWLCTPCRENKIPCPTCGRSINSSSGYVVDGVTYCEDCVRRCHTCGNTEHVDHLVFVENVGMVCRSCIQRYTFDENRQIYIAN